jgi:hypothetical protein
MNMADIAKAESKKLPRPVRPASGRRKRPTGAPVLCRISVHAVERELRGAVAGPVGLPAVHATNCTRAAHTASKPKAIPVAVM